MCIKISITHTALRHMLKMVPVFCFTNTWFAPDSAAPPTRAALACGVFVGDHVILCMACANRMAAHDVNDINLRCNKLMLTIRMPRDGHGPLRFYSDIGYGTQRHWKAEV